MTRVVAEMEEFEEYEMGTTPIAFVGVHNPYTGGEGFERYYNITGSIKDNSISLDTSTYYYNTYKAYFKYVMNYPINICSDEDTVAVRNNPVVQGMPAFPADGSIQFVDGIMVVKMG